MDRKKLCIYLFTPNCNYISVQSMVLKPTPRKKNSLVAHNIRVRTTCPRMPCCAIIVTLSRRGGACIILLTIFYLHIYLFILFFLSLSSSGAKTESGIWSHLCDVINAGGWACHRRLTKLNQITHNTAARRHTIETENNSCALLLIKKIRFILIKQSGGLFSAEGYYRVSI